MKLLYKFTITICFLLIAFSCKGLNKESDQFYKKNGIRIAASQLLYTHTHDGLHILCD